MGIPCIKCFLEELSRKNLETNSRFKFLDILSIYANKTVHLTLHLCILHIINAALETVNSKIMVFKMLPKR